MLTFTPVTQRDIARLRRYYKKLRIPALRILCPRQAHVAQPPAPSWAEGAGCLIVRNFIDGQYCFDYPFPAMATRTRRSRSSRTTAASGIFPRPLRRPAGQGGAPCRALPLLPLFLPRASGATISTPPRICATLPDAATPASATTSTSSASSIPTPSSARSGRATCRSSRSSSATTRPSSPRRPTRRKNELRCAEKNAPHDRQPALPRRRHGAGRQAPLRRHGGALRRHAANSYRKSPLRL